VNDILKKIEQFHGHVGPYAVIGYRMGLLAKEKLGSDPFSKKAVVSTGTNPPLSCIIDGIQISSGCTYGKGNLSIKNQDTAKAEFSTDDGKFIQLILKAKVRKEIDSNVNKENMISYSEKMCEKSDEELFEII
jgi:formylmethanofuran dehydrogenase subunit E